LASANRELARGIVPTVTGTVTRTPNKGGIGANFLSGGILDFGDVSDSASFTNLLVFEVPSLASTALSQSDYDNGGSESAGSQYIDITSSGDVRLVRDSQAVILETTVGGVVAARREHWALVSWDQNTGSGFIAVDGRIRVSASVGTSNWINTGRYVLGRRRPSDLSATSDHTQYAHARWDSALSQEQARWLTRGRYRALFSPRPLQVSVPPIVAGTTSVESDLTASYSVVGTVSKDLAASYTVVAAISKDLAASYAVQVAVTQDLAASYSVVGTVSKDLAASYTVVAAVSKDLAASYAVQVAVTQDLAASYSVTGTVTKDFTASYDLLADSTVTKDFTGSYTITGSVESDLAASYSVREAVSKDLAASYIVVAAVQKDLTSSYSIQAAGTGATADEIATAVWAKIGEDGLPYGDLVRVLLAALSGRTEGIGTLNERYLSADGSKTRIDATFDSNNNRVAVTLDGTP
jgi:hypothetical protein